MTSAAGRPDRSFRGTTDSVYPIGPSRVNSAVARRAPAAYYIPEPPEGALKLQRSGELMFWRRYSRGCCCSCRRCRPQPEPRIETWYYAVRVIDIPMTTYYGEGYTQTDCCIDTKNVLQEISDTLKRRSYCR